jgi:hypothetical protein
MKFFPNTEMELQSISVTLQWLAEQAISFGLPEKHLTVTNSRQKIDKVVRDYRKAAEQAEKLGYTSLGVALKALSQIKNRQEDISYLPEVFHTFPLIWVRGKVDSRPGKKEDGFKPMTPNNAKRKYRVIVPLLIEAWQLAERRKESEQIHDTIVRDYLSVSAEQFEDSLYRYIYDMEEVTLEQEFAELLPATQEEIESTYKHMTDPNRIYGVVPKEGVNGEEQI